MFNKLIAFIFKKMLTTSINVA